MFAFAPFLISLIMHQPLYEPCLTTLRLTFIVVVDDDDDDDDDDDFGSFRCYSKECQYFCCLRFIYLFRNILLLSLEYRVCPKYWSRRS